MPEDAAHAMRQSGPADAIEQMSVQGLAIGRVGQRTLVLVDAGAPDRAVEKAHRNAVALDQLSRQFHSPIADLVTAAFR